VAVVFVLYVLIRYIHHFMVKGKIRTSTKDAVPGP
jgi:hypothetical protein